MKCPECQTEFSDGANFCIRCGQELSLKKKLTKPSPPPDAERRRMTVLFSDLSGYTAITEKLDPEEVKEITSSIFDGIREVVRKYEGFIERFTGDGALSLFGVPKAHEDDPIRAIRAAMEIHGFVDSLSPRYEQKIGSNLSMHSGVNTGLAVTADVDPEKGTHGVTGDAINVAAKLRDLAGAHEILVGPDTYKASNTHCTFQPLKPAKIKGKSGLIPIYKVVSVKAATAHAHQEMQIFSEMLGRDQELAKLELHILKAINGQGSVVNVFGEPGIGKSRLLAELRQREVSKRVRFIEGRSISIGKSLSFHPIIDLFKQWSKIMENDTSAEALNKLEVAVHSVCGDEVDEVFPFVATLMGMRLTGKYSQRMKGIEGEALEKLILKNVRELLIRSTKLIPIVIVMEDLHWADTTSIELLKSLFRIAQNHRVVFINIFRPGYWQEDDRNVETLSQWLPEIEFAEIAIKPLDRQMGKTLVNNMLQSKGLRYAMKQQIVDRACGNPFFIEEIVRSLIDEGVIVRTNGIFEVTEKIDHVEIPSSINGVLMARIDRLEDRTRELIKIASVIGRSFFDKILKEVATSIDEVDERLAYLKDAHFIRDRMRMEELEYLFKHALAQEAVYESILIHQRKRIHRKVAQSIENIFQERLQEFYGMLAFHYSKADEPEKAEEYMMKAGEEALKSSASSEALHYYKEALSLYLVKYSDAVDPEKVAMLEKNIALAFYNRGQYEEALEYFDKALNYYWDELPKNTFSEISKLLSAILHLLITLYLPFMKFRKSPTQRDVEVVDLLYKKTKALSVIAPKKFFLEFLYMYKEVTNFDLQKFRFGLEIYIGASALFSFTGISFKLSRKILDSAKNRVVDNRSNIFILYDLLDTVHNYLEGNWKSIKSYDDDLVNRSLSIGEMWGAIQHLYWHGFLYIYQGSFDIAKSIINKLDEIYELYEHDLSKSFNYELNINLLMERRQLNDALIKIKAGIGFAEKADSYFLLEMYSCQAWIHILMGSMEEAGKSLKHANKIRHEVEQPVPFQLSNYCRSQLEYNLYRLNESIRDGNKSMSSKYRKQAAKSGKMMLKVAKNVAQHRTESYKLKGVYYWLINDQEEALIWWRKAIEEGRRLDASLELSRTYMEVGKRLLGPESKYKELNGVKAEEYLDKAKTMFEEMDLHWDIDELERLNLYRRCNIR